MILRSGTGRATCTRCRGSRAGRARRSCIRTKQEKKEIEIVIEFGMRDKDLSCSFSPPFHPSSLFRAISALKTSPSGSSSSFFLGGKEEEAEALKAHPNPPSPSLFFEGGKNPRRPVRFVRVSPTFGVDLWAKKEGQKGRGKGREGHTTSDRSMV